MTFDPLGNLYSSDCHSKPLYQLLRGAYYPSFGKPDDGLGFGPDMMDHSHNSTAIDGATYYAADQYPEAYRDTLFIGNVVTNRINHDKLQWRGSTPKAIEQPQQAVGQLPQSLLVDPLEDPEVLVGPLVHACEMHLSQKWLRHGCSPPTAGIHTAQAAGPGCVQGMGRL